MQAWTHFFLGTPRRFLGTLVVLLLVFGLCFPQTVGSAVHALLAALLLAIGPFVQPLLTLAIAIIGIGVIMRAVFPKKKKGNK